MRQFWTLAAVGSLVALAACGSRHAVTQSEASAPTVSYSYSDDDDYERVDDLADDYCEDQYGLDAVLLHRDRDGNAYEATFRCE